MMDLISQKLWKFVKPLILFSARSIRWSKIRKHLKISKTIFFVKNLRNQRNVL
jgi:hypothetical protein